MSLILPGIYSIGHLQSSCLTDDEVNAVDRLNDTSTRQVTTCKKIYAAEPKTKRDSSICCFTLHGSKQYGVISCHRQLH